MGYAGGLPQTAYIYIEENEGIDTEECLLSLCMLQRYKQINIEHLASTSLLWFF